MIEPISNEIANIKRKEDIGSNGIDTGFKSTMKATIESKKQASENDFKSRSTHDFPLSSESILSGLSQIESLQSNASILNVISPDSLSGVSSLDLEEASNLLSGVRSELMSGIKSSVLNLENIINDPINNVPEEWQFKFNQVIDQIKKDFTLGFGESFEEVEPLDIQDSDNLIDTLFGVLDQHKGFFEQIDNRL